MADKLDIEKNRRTRNYSTRQLALRSAWSIGRWLFRLVPRPMHGTRAAILRLFGARVGRHVHVYPSAHVYFPWNLQIGDWSAIGEDALIYNLGPVTIGDRVTVSQRAHLCAGSHDYTRPELPLLRPPIDIGSNAWIAADAFIGPGVKVGEGAVVGARAVAVKDVPAWQVVAGNPARQIRKREMIPPEDKTDA